ncbi:hypothetical protein [Streptomyces sp. NPDC013171]|uniref:hypothetical protein n=1 Tax=Streptomyces sp. NPDC013171 TaxID=3364863 RepID=UPI0036A04C04
MPDRPIIPTRIIPAGAPLPDRPPNPDDIPPWRAPAPAPPHSGAHPSAHPAPDPPRTRPHPTAHPPHPPHPSAHPHFEPAHPSTIEVRLTYEPFYVEPEPAPSLWDRIRSIAPVWKIAAALAAAAFPIPGVGYSLGGVWAYCVSEARTEVGVTWAYGLALVPLCISGRVVKHTRSLRALFVCSICLIGVTGAVHLYDPVTALTGVHPR